MHVCVVCNKIYKLIAINVNFNLCIHNSFHFHNMIVSYFITVNKND